ncbi:MAG: MBL fold metallo-hydrolase [Candidatus Eisenbacteria bacterium]|uniref:MBL fold metallo-hydrolase n=1 Tax=Eiseniibacteriota bacterium TaxID=2212470 RepID=A0A9D6LBT2_UNCEI|nr:MBL fold metallo-hydrolase [Candidatus Eisenbacteria bacterium]
MGGPLSIAFQGAARTVTGSRHHIRFGERTWLFDCGLYQGHRDEADGINRTFVSPPGSLDTLVISHAHLDHIGNVPTLVSQGYAGRVHCTTPTAELAAFMLADSAHLMQQDAEHLARHGKARAGARPLYGAQHVTETVSRFVTHDYHAPWDLFPDVRVEYFDAGHILGSALTTFTFRNGERTFRLGMSGDLGRGHRPILRDPEHHPAVDALVLESTYGDRFHASADATTRGLCEAVSRTIARGGRVLIPSFAVGRTQEVVATLHGLIRDGTCPDAPIFVDSPMAREATEVFTRHPECFDAETAEAFRRGGEPFGFRRLRYVATPDESRSLNDLREPCIIVAASGMCEGGRILHHLAHGLGDPKNTVLFVGYQGDGTLGRRLLDHATTVNVLGEPVRVGAEIAALDGFSAHADQGELVAWVTALDPMPKRIFLVHGDLGPAETLAGVLRQRTPAEVFVPEKNQEFALWS